MPPPGLDAGARTPMDPEVDAAGFRQVLGHFCTGVTVITAAGDGRPAGFACQAFAGVSWSPSPSGAPVLPGVLTWVECAVAAVHEAGDHYLVTGRVTALGPCEPGRPLLFYRGRYAATGPDAAAGPPEVVDTLLAWPRHADWM